MKANKISVGVVIGGAVASTFKSSISKATGELGKMKRNVEDIRGIRSLISETRKLQDQYSDAFRSGQRNAELLRSQVDKNLSVLRQNRIEVSNLGGEYERLGKRIRSFEMRERGVKNQQIGRSIITGAVGAGAALSVPTMKSAQYSAEIRDTAITGGFAGTELELQMLEQIRATSRDVGIKRNELAAAVGALVRGGMGAREALSYDKLIGKFSVGQGATPEETAKMIAALSQQAGIQDTETMQKALEQIAYYGKAGNFEAADMARSFPELLASMKSLGMVGLDSVNQLGAMLQVLRDNTGTSAEAVTNLNNWIAKIGSPQSIKAYDNALGKSGAYEDEKQRLMSAGMSNLEAEFELAKSYIEHADPKQAAELQKKAAELGRMKNAAARKKEMDAFLAKIKTGELYRDQYVVSALIGYMQGRDRYYELKKGGNQAAADAEAGRSGLDADLQLRRQTSLQKWNEAFGAMDNALERLGSAISPVTDRVADLTKWAAELTDSFIRLNPTLGSLAAVGVGAAATVGGAYAAYGTMQRVRGRRRFGGSILTTQGSRGGMGPTVGALAQLGAGMSSPTPVLVTNWPTGGLGALAGGSDGKGSRRPRRGQRPRNKAIVSKAGVITSSATAAAGVGRAATPKVGAIQKLGSIGGKIAGKAVPALVLADAAYTVYDVARGPGTTEEKAADLGGATGSIGLGIAGAKLGAFLGPIGALVGGAIGAVAGTEIGQRIGKTVVSWWKGNKEPSQEDKAKMALSVSVTTAGKNPEQLQTEMRELARFRANIKPPEDIYKSNEERLTAAINKAIKKKAEEGDKSVKQRLPSPQISVPFSPSISVTVQGNADNPDQIARAILPHLTKLQQEQAEEVQRRLLYDDEMVM